jgi:hypothetical protein
VRATSYLEITPIITHTLNIPLFLSQLELSTKIQKPSLPFSVNMKFSAAALGAFLVVCTATSSSSAFVYVIQ